VPAHPSAPLQALPSWVQALPLQQAWPIPPHWQVFPDPQVKLA
jgi:hypothetical protein